MVAWNSQVHKCENCNCYTEDGVKHTPFGMARAAWYCPDCLPKIMAIDADAEEKHRARIRREMDEDARDYALQCRMLRAEM